MVDNPSATYPLLFEPNLRTMVWGGSRLTQWKHLPLQDHIGESWEVSTFLSMPSVVANGPCAGMTLEEVLGLPLPLLVKFIDSRHDLSIQVHPNDEMARRRHHCLGKSEMWYIINVQPGGFLYSGFSKHITPEEYKQRIADGTITEVLARHELRPGDVFYIPAGRVHAIGAGVLLAEIQQSSDMTYRIYDYGRLGLDGKPRQLHTDLAAEALDFNVYPDYRTEWKRELPVSNCLTTPFFTVNHIQTTEQFQRNLLHHNSFVILLSLRGNCRITADGHTVTLTEANSCFLPTPLTDYTILPDGEIELLETYL